MADSRLLCGEFDTVHEYHHMSTLEIPFGAWYGDAPLGLQFPNHWHVQAAPMNDAPPVEDGAIRRAFERPIATPTIAAMAKGKRRVVIAVDDLTRPTEAARFIPYILEQLHAAGVARDAVSFLMAVGSHRALTRQDMIKKLGRAVVEQYRVYNHSPFDDLIAKGTSKRGFPVFLNRRFMEADLRIGVGLICPHPMVGWGGGGKIVMPGVCGIETLAAVHGSGVNRGLRRVVAVRETPLREEIDDIAARSGLDVIVNAVSTSNGKTAGLFVGDFVKAHEAGVRFGLDVYGTTVPAEIDVGIFNAYPEDTEFLQCGKALNVWSDPDTDLVRKGGTIVIATAASEGRGVHYLFDEGMRLYVPPSARPAWLKKTAGRDVIFFSPNVPPAEVESTHGSAARLCNSWDAVIEQLAAKHGRSTRAVVFPCCALQYLRTV